MHNVGFRGKPSLLAPNVLQREFTVDQPDQVWVTDISYRRTWGGFLYLAVVMDLYSRKIVGWSMKTSLAPSMSRRGNCWDNAVAESFFSSLKKERIRRRVYHTVEEAKADLFDYIEMFYNPRRRHSHLGDISPEAFERASAIG